MVDFRISVDSIMWKTRMIEKSEAENLSLFLQHFFFSTSNIKGHKLIKEH